MKYMALGFVAICALAMTSESAMAVVPGGGKSANDARFCFRSLEGPSRSGSGRFIEGCTVACWVTASGSLERPSTPRDFGVLP